jgi:phosphoserine aminotransferase
MGKRANILQSLRAFHILTTSTCGVLAFSNLTNVPSGLTILFGGTISIVEAVPMNMIMRKARYVPVLTEASAPFLILMARAMTAPMKEPNWKIAQKIPNALPY